MPKAIWNGVVIAESKVTEVVEGNHYFPAASLDQACFEPAENTSVCGWKGTANYYNIKAGGKTNPGAAWYYAAPKQAAENIRGHVAFWKGVEIVASQSDQANVSDAGGTCEI